MRSLVPALNSKTGKRKQPWPAALPSFIMPLRNPTLTCDAGTLPNALQPQQFHLMNCFVVLFAPHLFWPGLVEVKCPLCGVKAAAHGWSTSIRKVAGVLGVWYINGARYKCSGCKGVRAEPLGAFGAFGYLWSVVVGGWGGGRKAVAGRRSVNTAKATASSGNSKQDRERRQ